MSALVMSSPRVETSVVREAVASLSQASWPARLVSTYVLLLPVIAGIPRGQVVPMLRLSEVAQVGLTGIAVLLALASFARGNRWQLVVQPVDWWMFAFAFCGSVVPLVSLIARGQSLNVAAIAAAFPVFKYLLLWVLVRLCIRTVADLGLLLFCGIAAACFVAVLAIPEGLGIGPSGAITHGLVGGDGGVAADGRAFTLLGSSISSGAVIAICAALSFGVAVRFSSLTAMAATGLLLVGALATGQASAVLAIGLVFAVAAWQHRLIVRTVAIGIPAAVIAVIAMSPIIESRLADSAGRSIIPQSWLIRWVNVTELYWPQVADGGWRIGVHPDPVLLPPDTWRTEVYLESGYLWTLWVGGLPLLICFVGLLISAWRALGVQALDPVHEIVRIAGRCAIAFMAVFNVLDPHLTLRGGADLLYMLVPAALAGTPLAVPCTRRLDMLRLVSTDDRRPLSPTARIQFGEIGGPLLRSSGWSTVSVGHGRDRGVDVAVRDGKAIIGEARLYFEGNGASLDGLMLHRVRSVDDEASALVWRGIAICAASIGLESLSVPPGSHGLIELSARELVTLGDEANRLENLRLSEHDASVFDASCIQAQELRQDSHMPHGIRLETPTPLSRFRRLVDIVASSCGLLVFAPVAAVLAALIRRSSPGPVLFRQVRIGAGGRPFRILKFRSMDNRAGEDVHRKSIEDSLRAGEPDAKVTSDARITRVGAFMRTWSLDEVPQLLNVLRGEMTLVGPRPSLIWETSLFESRTRRRLQLTPGIAGLWQASGRGDLSTEEMLELDLEYADSASVSNDTRLLATTLKAVVTKSGAR